MRLVASGRFRNDAVEYLKNYRRVFTEKDFSCIIIHLAKAGW